MLLSRPSVRPAVGVGGGWLVPLFMSSDASGRRTSDGVDSAGGVGKFLAGSSEEVDKRSLPFSVHLSNLYCWQLVRGHEFAMCPTLLHPRHTIWAPGVPGDNSTLSTLTVLFLTISSAGTSGPTEKEPFLFKFFVMFQV